MTELWGEHLRQHERIFAEDLAAVTADQVRLNVQAGTWVPSEEQSRARGLALPRSRDQRERSRLKVKGETARRDPQVPLDRQTALALGPYLPAEFDRDRAVVIIENMKRLLEEYPLRRCRGPPQDRSDRNP